MATTTPGTRGLLTRAVLPGHVVYRHFAAQTVLLDLRTGRYHGLDERGGHLLEVIEATPSVERAATRLADEYGRPRAQVEQDLFAFCKALAERGLLELRFEPGGRAAA